MYACHRSHNQRGKRTGAWTLIERRKITITARTGTSETSTDTGTITILYGCLIPLELSNRMPPRTETWLGWGRRPGKKYGGSSNEANTMKVKCRITRGRGK